MTANGMVLVGVGFVLLARALGSSSGDGSFGAWPDPPAWARVMFRATGNRILVDDAVIEVVGLVWLAGGVAMLATRQAPDSAAFVAVQTILVLCFFAGTVTSLVIWFIREHLRR